MSVKSVDHLRMTAVYEPNGGGWVYAHVLEIPGINTSAPTRAEAKEMLVDAAREFIAARADDAGRRESPSTRYGARYAVWAHAVTVARTTLPRHRELGSQLTRGICRDLGVPPPPELA